MGANRWFRLIGCGLGLLTLLAMAPVVRADEIVFQDGLFHVFDGSCYYLKVRNNFWDEPTSVEMVSGAQVSYDANVYDTSELTVSGGTIASSLSARDSSQVTVSGGSVDYQLCAHDSSNVTVSGGNIECLYANHTSQVTVSGGTIDIHLYANNSSQVTVSGGSIDEDLWARDSSQVTVSGGNIAFLRASHSSQVTFSGGSIDGDLWAEDTSQVTVSGGTIEGMMDIYSTLTVEGSDFSISGIPVPLGTYTRFDERDPLAGALSGTFGSGETFTNNFEIHGDGQLVLTPEPATLALLAVGGLLLIRRRVK